MPAQRRIIERLVFRLVQKHIAGPTSASALQAIREINADGLHATLTLLNDNVHNAAKARYNSNAYMQLIRQVSRLNLNSDISLRPVQVGYAVDKSLMNRHLEEIIGFARDNNVKLWMEQDGGEGIGDHLALFREVRDAYGAIGAEIQPTQENAVTALDGEIEPRDLVKVRRYYDGEEKVKERKSAVDVYTNYIDRLLAKRAQVSVWERDMDVIKKLASESARYRKSVRFEVPLGSSKNDMKKLQQGKLAFSVYVPFGKDWVPYLVGRLAEGSVRKIAVALLEGNSGEHASES